MLKKNIRKYKIIEKHIEWTKSGNYMAARNLLWLLRKGYIKLGLGDTDWETEADGICACYEIENMGFCRDGVTRWYHFTSVDGKPAYTLKR